MAKFKVVINQWMADGPQLPGVVCACCGKPRTVVSVHTEYSDCAAPSSFLLCKSCLTDAIGALDEALRRSYRRYDTEDDGYPD